MTETSKTDAAKPTPASSNTPSKPDAAPTPPVKPSAGDKGAQDAMSLPLFAATCSMPADQFFAFSVYARQRYPEPLPRKVWENLLANFQAQQV